MTYAPDERRPPGPDMFLWRSPTATEAALEIERRAWDKCHANRMELIEENRALRAEVERLRGDARGWEITHLQIEVTKLEREIAATRQAGEAVARMAYVALYKLDRIADLVGHG